MTMSTPYSDCARIVGELHVAVAALERACGLLQLAPLAGREWYEGLTRKLLPQLSDDAYLVAAVVGGTNIGKSVVFNHIAGCRASATSPLASGTKHPVCLVPRGFAGEHSLQSVFPGFVLEEWTTSDAALEEHDDDRLYWRTSESVPGNLLVLDTPDIDSDARVNWRRADNIRRCADVLIAILTQQKYNDAAVKQFFRKAADEDKAVIVVFNQVQLPDDEAYWPRWLETFCSETGIVPEIVYVAPSDRRAAEDNRLPFFERRVTNSHGLQPVGLAKTPHDLMQDLSRLHFGEIKVRSLRGSLAQLLDTAGGMPAYLAEIEGRSGDFRAAADLLSAHNLAQIDDWPPVPNNLLVNEIRRWWQMRRSGWSARVHSFYNAVGSGLTWPFKYAGEKLRGPQTPPCELYRQREWSVILDAVEKVYQKLQWFGELGNELLQPRLERLLGGTSRSELLTLLEQEHARLDLQRELEQLVAREMKTFEQDSPQLYGFLKNLDLAAAAARPAISVVLMATGIMAPVGNAAAHLAIDSVTQTVVHVAGDVATRTAAAAVGDTALSSTTGSGMGFIQAKFRRLHASFAARRAGWLAAMLKTHLLGTLPEELHEAATLPEADEFRRVRSLLQQLSERLLIEVPESVV